MNNEYRSICLRVNSSCCCLNGPYPSGAAGSPEIMPSFHLSGLRLRVQRPRASMEFAEVRTLCSGGMWRNARQRRAATNKMHWSPWVSCKGFQAYNKQCHSSYTERSLPSVHLYPPSTSMQVAKGSTQDQLHSFKMGPHNLATSLLRAPWCW